MAELKKLKQIGSLKDYLKAFELILDKAQLSERQALSCFLAGLRHDIEMIVRMFNPRNLQEAYSLAKLQEAVKQDFGGIIPGGGRVGYNKNIVTPGSFQGIKTNAPVAVGVQEGGNKGSSTYQKKPLNLTSKQIEEKRQKNQCFWCEEKFTPGHRCKNRQLYMITVQDDEP